MHTVVVTVAASSQSFPAGTVSAGIQISLAAPSQTIVPITVAAPPYAASFSDVPADTYAITAQAIDASGNPLGEPITGTVTVSPDAVNIDVPASLSVIVQ